MDLKTVERRDKLKPRREPYWQSLSAGQYLGFRPSAGSGQGTWLARFYDPDSGKRPNRSLGDFGELPPGRRFDAAKRSAEEWFAILSRGGSAEDLTVREACERYAAGDADAAKRFPRYVYDDPVARIRLRRLREHHVKEWRARLEAMPALVTRNSSGKPVTRPRAPATVNRDMVAFRAALNAALARGEVDSALAWRRALQPTPNANGRRDLYLNKNQRRALLAELPADAQALCRGLCLLPLRPGALAALIVGDFDRVTNSLRIRLDKANADRCVLLPELTAALLKDLCRDKLPQAPLFSRADGSPWNKDAWKVPIKLAASAAALPSATTAYTLRHSTITDLVTGGLDLLTVAQISGTSVRMIEKHYGHLRADHAAAALAGLML
ncbi:MAG: tyrosine-type recombinase/integrase [Xanthomonadales bacterium]|nr:tyrosine-type recombinase/integrase [Xanthomonadales bacterium]MBN8492464.1 tyrosine-type recombinase/integrase [Burkholderiales bacterium]